MAPTDRSERVTLPRPEHIPEPPDRPFAWPVDPAKTATPRPNLIEWSAEDAIWRDGDWWIKAKWNGTDVVVELYHNSWNCCGRVWVSEWRNPWEWLLRLTRQQRVERAIEHLRGVARRRQAILASVDLRGVGTQHVASANDAPAAGFLRQPVTDISRALDATDDD